VHAGETINRSWEEMPCLWWDPVTKKCRHYEWRPVVCRDFAVGEEDYLRIRKERGIGPR
jgi:Fe-S-cluster containining protein